MLCLGYGRLAQRKTSLSAPDNLLTTDALCSHKIQTPRKRSTVRKISKEMAQMLAQEFNNTFAKDVASLVVADKPTKDVCKACNDKPTKNACKDCNDRNDFSTGNELKSSSEFVSIQEKEGEHNDPGQNPVLNVGATEKLGLDRAATFTSYRPKGTGTAAGHRARKLGTAGITNTNTQKHQPLPPTSTKKYKTRKSLVPRKPLKNCSNIDDVTKKESKGTKNAGKRVKKSSNVALRRESQLVVQ